MTTGSSLDILARVKQLLPQRWFSYVAPYRDAVLGGLSDLASWSYGLIYYAKAQTRLSTAYGIWLDIFSYDFLGPVLPRAGTHDVAYRALIQATILQERVTRNGMNNALTKLTGVTPGIFEPWNTYDTGAYSGPANVVGSPQYGQMGYGVGRGGYGSMKLTYQAFLKVQRTAPSGIPIVSGWGQYAGGYGVGSIEYISPLSTLSGVTDAMIYQLINLTKPTGSIMWVAFVPTPLRFQEDAIAPVWLSFF